MKIDKIKINLPEKEDAVLNFFLSCEARKKLVDDTEDHYKKHLIKAKHDLTRAIAEFEDECWDWAIVMSYYTIHHGGNALLSKNKNKFSKNHSSFIISLKHYNLIDKSLFDELADINGRFSDILSLDLAFQLRKISQYNVDEWEDLTKEDAELVLNVAKKLVKFAEGRI